MFAPIPSQRERQLVGMSFDGWVGDAFRDASRELVQRMFAQSFVTERKADARPSGTEHQAFASKGLEVAGRIEEVLCHFAILEHMPNMWQGQTG